MADEKVELTAEMEQFVKYIEGLTVLDLSKLVKALEERLGSPFLLLPSSVHEVLCLPADQGYEDHSVWSDMVREVNDTCLEPQERLSDHAYLCMEGALLPV